MTSPRARVSLPSGELIPRRICEPSIWTCWEQVTDESKERRLPQQACEFVSLRVHEDIRGVPPLRIPGTLPDSTGWDAIETHLLFYLKSPVPRKMKYL